MSAQGQALPACAPQDVLNEEASHWGPLLKTLPDLLPHPIPPSPPIAGSWEARSGRSWRLHRSSHSASLTAHHADFVDYFWREDQGKLLIFKQNGVSLSCTPYKERVSPPVFYLPFPFSPPPGTTSLSNMHSLYPKCCSRALGRTSTAKARSSPCAGPHPFR